MKSLKNINFIFYNKKNCPDNFQKIYQDNILVEFLDICNICFLPIQDFYALIDVNKYSIEYEYLKALENYDKEHNEETIKNIDNKKYLHVKKEQLMICKYETYQNKEIYSFKISLEKILLNTNTEIILNISNSENAIKRNNKRTCEYLGKNLLDENEFRNYTQGPCLTIILSKEEIEKYLVPFNIIDDFEYNLTYVTKKMFFKIETKETKSYSFLKNHIYQRVNKYNCIIDGKEKLDVNKIKVLYFINIICPILYLKNNYEEEILLSHIYGIEAILEKLQEICENNTSENYIKAIIEAGTLIKRIIESADSISIARKENNIKTASDIIKEIEDEESRKTLKTEEFNKKLQESIKNQRQNQITNFVEEIKIRKEILDIYDENF